MTRAALITMLVLAAAGCAARKPRIDPRTAAAARATAEMEVRQADTLLAGGCYRCLLEAWDLYERARQRTEPPLDLRRQRLTVSLLLTLREKELGLPAARWMDAAAPLAAPEDQLRLAVVRAAPWERAGASVEFEPPPRVAPEERAQWKAALAASAPAGVLDQYLLVTVFCTISPGPPVQERLPMDVLDLSRPILQYRVGICNSAQRFRLEDAVSNEPRFVEASFFLGRYEMSAVFTRGDWLTRALPFLAVAHAALPEAPIVTVVYAGAMRARGALARAVALYDEALAVRPAQREALLGRAVALTYLDKPDEAIAVATRLLDLGTWYVGDAYFYRALNHYQKGDVATAAADIADAKKTLANGDVATLSGRIAYDQHRPMDARADFTEARRVDSGNCTAHWYLGLLDIDQQAWRPAVANLSVAAGCYAAAADSFRAELQRLPEDLPDDARQQQTGDFERRIAESLRQAARSSYNAAQASIRLGDTASAISYARSAAEHDDMRERAGALIRSLGRKN